MLTIPLGNIVRVQEFDLGNCKLKEDDLGFVSALQGTFFDWLFGIAKETLAASRDNLFVTNTSLKNFF